MSDRKRATIDEAVKPAETFAAEAPWPDPLALVADHDRQRPFPVQALPKLMRDAVTCYQAYGQQAISMVASSALSAASLACQGLVNVARDDGLTGPCSLSKIDIAESGARKTSLDNRMARAIRRWEQAKREEMAPVIKAAKAKRDAWEARRSGILAGIQKLGAKTGTDAEAERLSLEADLERLVGDEPPVPLEIGMFLADVTTDSLRVQLAHGWPTAALWSDEAGLVVGSHAMSEESALRFLAILNKLWDAPEYAQADHRISRRGAEIKGRRLTVNLMLQRAVFEKLAGGQGGLARHIGALARFLICEPESTIGTRSYVSPEDDAAAMQAWDERLTQLLNLPLPVKDPTDPTKALDPLVLRLDSDAFRAWVEFHDAVELQLRPAGEFALMKDFASKTAEQAARIAAIFHVMQYGPSGIIDRGTMAAACQIALWYLAEARRILGMTARADEVEDAQILLGWLRDRAEPPSIKDVLRLGPARLRDSKRRDTAIRLLTDHGLARLEERSGTKRVIISPRESEV